MKCIYIYNIKNLNNWINWNNVQVEYPNTAKNYNNIIITRTIVLIIATLNNYTNVYDTIYIMS